MRRATLTIAAIGILIALSAGTAVAQSGIDQYQENVPGAGGGGRGEGAGGGGGGGGAGGGGAGTEAGTAAGTGVLDPQTAAELEALGADGQAAAGIAEGTAPEGAGGGAGGDDGAPGGPGSEASEDRGGLSGVGDVLDQVVGGSDDGDGMGVLLPILLALAVIGALLIALAARRGRQGTGPSGNA